MLLQEDRDYRHSFLKRQHICQTILSGPASGILAPLPAPIRASHDPKLGFHASETQDRPVATPRASIHACQLGSLAGSGGQGRNRTTDTRIFSPLLYRLSYLAFGTRSRMERDRKEAALYG